MAVPSRIRASPSADQRADADRRLVARAMRIGLWVWPSFASLDAFMCVVAFPGAPFLLFACYRVVVELAFFAVYRASRRPNVDIRLLFWGLNVSFGIAAVAIAMMAVDLGGIRSPYMHGISIVALVRAALVPGEWRRSLPSYLRIGLAFPLVIGAGAVLSPVARAEWLAGDGLIVFASNYVFVVASSFIGLVTGHVVWRAQEQLFRARRVGGYRLQAPIGRGGMGEVWLAWDLSLRRNVALKLLRVGSTSAPETVRRFEREAQATSQLRGPHVVQIYDFGASEDGLYYIAMEYLQGMDLGTLVERFGPLPPARAVHFILQACEALEEAHAAGIIHRDLKPHNLFVTRVGGEADFLKLLDFGIVRLRMPDAAADALTATGLLMGTPAYLAPELWLGVEADERSDLYALGVTLRYLLTGTTPGEAWMPSEVLRVVESRALEQAPSAGAGVPEELWAIVRRCLARDPEARTPSARALHRELRAVFGPTPWPGESAEAFWREADRARFG